MNSYTVREPRHRPLVCSAPYVKASGGQQRAIAKRCRRVSSLRTWLLSDSLHNLGAN